MKYLNTITFSQLVIFFFSFLVFTSCRECDPVTVPGNQLIVRFYDKTSKNAITPDFKSVFGQGMDTKLIEVSGNGAYALPLKRTGQSTSFIFQLEGLSDTLDIGYNKKVWVNGPDCGAFERYEDVGVFGNDGAIYNSFLFPEGSLFDSAGTVIPEVTGDTISDNIAVFIDECNTSKISPSRDMLVAFFDKFTGENVSVSFQAVYIKGKEFDPLFTDKDRLPFIFLPLEDESPITFVFEFFDTFNDTLLTTEFDVSFNNTSAVASYPTDCILYDGTGNIRLSDSTMVDSTTMITYPEGSLFESINVEKDYMDGTIFKSNPNAEPEFRINIAEPNVKIFL